MCTYTVYVYNVDHITKKMAMQNGYIISPGRPMPITCWFEAVPLWNRRCSWFGHGKNWRWELGCFPFSALRSLSGWWGISWYITPCIDCRRTGHFCRLMPGLGNQIQDKCNVLLQSTGGQWTLLSISAFYTFVGWFLGPGMITPTFWGQHNPWAGNCFWTAPTWGLPEKMVTPK